MHVFPCILDGYVTVAPCGVSFSKEKVIACNGVTFNAIRACINTCIHAYACICMHFHAF